MHDVVKMFKTTYLEFLHSIAEPILADTQNMWDTKEPNPSQKLFDINNAISQIEKKIIFVEEYSHYAVPRNFYSE